MDKNRLQKEDEKIEKMLKAWDIVRCKICGKKISMLTARSIHGGEYYICREH